MDSFTAPAADEHTDYCRVFVWRWRISDAASVEARNDVSRWPCMCDPARPWMLARANHPAWCRTQGDHPWHECVVGHTARASSKEK